MKQLIALILAGGLIAVMILLAQAAPRWAEAQAQEAQARQSEAQARAVVAEAHAQENIITTLAVCALLALALLVVGLPAAVMIGALMAVRAVKQLAPPPQIYQLPDHFYPARLDRPRARVSIGKSGYEHEF